MNVAADSAYLQDSSVGGEETRIQGRGGEGTEKRKEELLTDSKLGHCRVRE